MNKTKTTTQRTTNILYLTFCKFEIYIILEHLRYSNENYRSRRVYAQIYGNIIFKIQIHVSVFFLSKGNNGFIYLSLNNYISNLKYVTFIV